MDQELQDLMAKAMDSSDRTVIDVQDPRQPKIEFGAQEYPVKPLDQLYGKGTGRDSLDPQDEIFMPLLTLIEGELSRAGQANPRLTDGDALLALKALSMNPAADVGTDELAALVQAALRLCLSLNDYSRQDVKMAIRKVTQSVQRHTSLAGRRGYLEFIKDYA